MPMIPSNPLVGAVTLYGDYKYDASFGSPVVHKTGKCNSLTEAVWFALLEMGDAGLTGYVRIFAPNCLKFADVQIGAYMGYYSDLPWEKATPVKITPEEILSAAVVD